MMNDYLQVEGNPMFDGYRLRAFDDWWKIFVYRFVGYDHRTGPNLNYAERLKSSTAMVYPDMDHLPMPGTDDATSQVTGTSSPKRFSLILLAIILLAAAIRAPLIGLRFDRTSEAVVGRSAGFRGVTIFCWVRLTHVVRAGAKCGRVA